MSTKWSHLPNAHLIDWVLESLKTNPEAWDAAGAAWVSARDAARDAARAATRDAALGAAGAGAWDAASAAVVEVGALAPAEDAAWAAFQAAAKARDAALGARAAAWDAIMALIVDDNAAEYLHMESDNLKVWAILSGTPAARLLIPANQIWQQEHARAFIYE